MLVQEHVGRDQVVEYWNRGVVQVVSLGEGGVGEEVHLLVPIHLPDMVERQRVFRILFGDVTVQVERLFIFSCLLIGLAEGEQVFRRQVGALDHFFQIRHRLFAPAEFHQRLAQVVMRDGVERSQLDHGFKMFRRLLVPFLFHVQRAQLQAHDFVVRVFRHQGEERAFRFLFVVFLHVKGSQLQLRQRLGRRFRGDVLPQPDLRLKYGSAVCGQDHQQYQNGNHRGFRFGPVADGGDDDPCHDQVHAQSWKVKPRFGNHRVQRHHTRSRQQGDDNPDAGKADQVRCPRPLQYPPHRVKEDDRKRETGIRPSRKRNVGGKVQVHRPQVFQYVIKRERLDLRQRVSLLVEGQWRGFLVLRKGVVREADPVRHVQQDRQQDSQRQFQFFFMRGILRHHQHVKDRQQRQGDQRRVCTETQHEEHQRNHDVQRTGESAGIGFALSWITHVKVKGQNVEQRRQQGRAVGKVRHRLHVERMHHVQRSGDERNLKQNTF